MGSSKSILHLIHHRSKNRIRDFGEVFTPEKYVNQMLDMLDKSVWTDTNTVFYEPTCGHGNFVEAIVKRRLKAFFKQAKRQKIEEAHFYAVANTLNNLWAIDIDSKNISLCRERVKAFIFGFLTENDKINPFTRENKDFLTHVLCCIDWQIHENEALSCLEKDSVKAKKLADKTAISREWLKKNKHKPINFEMNWCQYFKSCKKENIVPSEYTNKFRLVSSLIDDKKKNLKKEKIKKPNYKSDYNIELPIAV
ncbi:MAG: hypothetical protein OXC37_04785 [Bdellovibrionaceae bacterium]|nr:hypothetical protein [Pseudobdellovibrionaceae bacterium]